jgi:hypothetical protein
MLRWGSAVQASREVEEYYVMSLNEKMNTNFFDVSKHPKLQWLLATTVSPGIGTFKHPWIAGPKREGSNNKTMKFLRSLYPHLSEDELELLRTINDKNDIKQLARDHGWDDKRIKDEL